MQISVPQPATPLWQVGPPTLYQADQLSQLLGSGQLVTTTDAARSSPTGWLSGVPAAPASSWAPQPMMERVNARSRVPRARSIRGVFILILLGKGGAKEDGTG